MFLLPQASAQDGSVRTVLKTLVQENINQRRSEMNLWEISNELDVIGYKISSVRNVLELIAERIVDEPESGATWATSEMLEVLEEKLNAVSGKVMQMHRDQEPKPTKEKKK